MITFTWRVVPSRGVDATERHKTPLIRGHLGPGGRAGQAASESGAHWDS